MSFMALAGSLVEVYSSKFMFIQTMLKYEVIHIVIYIHTRVLVYVVCSISVLKYSLHFIQASRFCLYAT